MFILKDDLRAISVDSIDIQVGFTEIVNSVATNMEAQAHRGEFSYSFEVNGLVQVFMYKDTKVNTVSERLKTLLEEQGYTVTHLKNKNRPYSNYEEERLIIEW